MKKIKLTRGKYALVDDEDFDWLNQWKWFAEKVYKYGNICYASRGLYSRKLKKHQKMIRMHRLLIRCLKGKLIDHIDRNGLNNQKKNLRIANKSINALNSRRAKPNEYKN